MADVRPRTPTPAPRPDDPLPARAGARARVDDLAGYVLAGRYRLRTAIGAGASGTVYEADDVQLGRRVAVKVLHRALADDVGFLQRFRAEARVAASLHHRNILTVHDWGEDDVPFMVTELLDGGSLRAMLDAGERLSPAQCAHLGHDVAVALDYAHSRRIVHRDIKPANLLFDEHGVVRIADFGLARALAEASWTEPAGAVFGTARYASPEQARGTTLDARSDLYSLALVLYEAITASIPFASDTLMGTLAQRTQRAITAPGEWGPLRAVIERAGQVDPGDRYPDAATMAHALRDAAEVLGPPQPLPLAGADAGPDPHPTRAVAAVTEKLRASSSSAPHRAASSIAVDTVVDLRVADPAPALFDQDARDATADGAGDGDGGAGAARRAPRRPGRFVPLVVAVVSVVALVLGVYALGSLGAPAGSVVPGLVGHTTEQARALADDAGFTVSVERRTGDDAEGIVLEQDPQAGTRSDGDVRLVVSSGPPPVEVPSLAGLDRNSAILALDDAGLIGRFRDAHHETVPAGEVVSQQPAVGAQAPRDSQVEVVISTGPPPREVPRLEGSDPDEAEQALVDLGFVVDRVQVFDDEVRAGDVVGTAPGAGELVDYGSRVELRVSKGPERRAVPNVYGMKIDRACEEIEADGFECVPSGNYSPNARVTGMDPQPETLLRVGATVRLFFGGEGD
jgi:serine/threonine-protein kinase